MPTVSVYDLNRQPVGEYELSEVVFGVRPNEGLMWDVLKAQLASRRRGTHQAKTRGEVAGSTRKLYRQKGTGRARHGAIRAPIFVGGGKALGPRPRDYAYRPPRKMRLGAMRSALSLRLQEDALLVLDSFEMEEIKTKRAAEVLSRLGAMPSALVVDAADNETLRKSVRNLPDHTFLPPEGVNLYDVLRHRRLVLTRRALQALEARFGA